MAFIAAPVAAWALGAGASAGVAALAGSVAVGVVSGAVVGAASAAIRGENIFKGALKGAVIGGATAGIFSGLGMASGLASAESQLAKFGVESAATGASSSIPSAGLPSAAVETGVVEGATGSIPSGTGGVLSNIPAQAPASSSILSDSTAKVLANVGQGIASGYGEQKAQESENEATKEMMRFQAEQNKIDKASNLPGEFKVKTANIQIPDWWNRYLGVGEDVAPELPPGILNQGVA